MWYTCITLYMMDSVHVKEGSDLDKNKPACIEKAAQVMRIITAPPFMIAALLLVLAASCIRPHTNWFLYRHHGSMCSMDRVGIIAPVSISSALYHP